MATGSTVNDEATVPRKWYFGEDFFTPQQWSSFFAQINCIRGLQPSSVLEIGIGNGFVSSCLERCGIPVTTVDINPDLAPDIVVDITELKESVGAGQFDLVLCAQVLEHLPLGAFDRCLHNLAHATNKWVIITLPRAGKRLIHCCVDVFGRRLECLLRIPGSRIYERHYWEIDSQRETRMRHILDRMKKHFTVHRYGRVPGHANHYFFVLAKNYQLKNGARHHFFSVPLRKTAIVNLGFNLGV